MSIEQEIASWIDRAPDTQELRSLIDAAMALESEVAALRAELAQHKASLPTCEKHKPYRGARNGCVICSGHALSHALSRIDYACGEPNEMECSDYDVHYNEDEVVKRVVAFRAEVEGMREDAERYRWLRDHSPVGIGEMASVRGSHTVAEIDAAIDAARKESSKC